MGRQTDLILNRDIGIELGVAGRVGLPRTDISIELGATAGGLEIHRRQPVVQRMERLLGTFGIAMRDQGKQAAGEMAGIVPACELDLFGLLRVLAVRPRRIRIAAIGADQAIQEEVRNADRTVLEGLQAARSGRQVSPGRTLSEPRQK